MHQEQIRTEFYREKKKTIKPAVGLATFLHRVRNYARAGYPVTDEVMLDALASKQFSVMKYFKDIPTAFGIKAFNVPTRVCGNGHD